MNQKAIWIIIGLMSLAVVGVLTLQMSFINNSRRLNEEQFDKHVEAGMKRVAEQLENVENFQLQRFANGFSIATLQETMSAAVQLQQEMFNTPIEERIEIIRLDQFLKNELGNDIPFSYGV